MAGTVTRLASHWCAPLGALEALAQCAADSAIWHAKMVGKSGEKVESDLQGCFIDLFLLVCHVVLRLS